MVGFFPTPYADECLYSVLCRYYAHCGYSNYETCVKELFGGLQNLTQSVFLPMKIDCIDNWYSPLSGVTRRSIAVSNTLYPYWAMCYAPAFRTKMDGVINGGASAIETNNEGSLRSRRSWAKHLKYCPLCAAKDAETYGEPYWHRQHQLSEVFYCTKHKVRLINSNIPIRQTASGFYPASSTVVLEQLPDVVDGFAPFKDKLLLIAGESEWLIKHGLEINWSANWRDKYGKLLRDKGLASFQGRCDYPALELALSEYWGQELLEFLIGETADTRFNGWFHKIEKNKMRAFLPLYHILLMCFLAGSVSDFVDSNPADTPYGHPPFLCENPICPHYHIDGADMVEMQYYGNGATAAFECVYCGMVYRHNKAKHSRELRVIKENGHLWENEFIRCCRDDSITNRQMCEIFKRDITCVIAHKKELGLTRRLPYWGSDVSALDYYKSQAEAVCSEHNEVTIPMLNKHAPGAYDYIRDHDPEWMRDRVVSVSDRQFIRDYENELLTSIQGIISRLAANGYPKRQVTYGYIAELIGSTRDKLRCRSALNAALSNIIESKSDWIRRRSTEVCKERKVAGKPTTAKTIKRELCLREPTFTQYYTLIQEVIDAIYE
jgi:hypothetical protein